ncbi:MAG: encapsulin-associated ferritin-like protein [Gammaproteobacteria bacterium]
MANSVGYHEPLEKMSRETIEMHRALASLQEELEAADWYRQRADACDNDALRDIILHNMREEIEHASMILEWLRRHSPDFAKQLKTYLLTEAPITEDENLAMSGNGGGEEDNEFTIGKP